MIAQFWIKREHCYHCSLKQAMRIFYNITIAFKRCIRNETDLQDSNMPILYVGYFLIIASIHNKIFYLV